MDVVFYWCLVCFVHILYNCTTSNSFFLLRDIVTNPNKFIVTESKKSLVIKTLNMELKSNTDTMKLNKTRCVDLEQLDKNALIGVVVLDEFD